MTGNPLDQLFRFQVGNRVKVRRPDDGSQVVVRVTARSVVEGEGGFLDKTYTLAGEGGSVMWKAAALENEPQ